MKINIKYTFFIVVSLLVFTIWPHETYFKYQYIGNGDYVSPFNIKELILEKSYIYESKEYAGFNTAYLVSCIFPYFLYFLITEYLAMSPFIATTILLYIIVLTAQISMSKLLEYIAIEKFNKNKVQILIITLSIIYGFSPYLISLINPGHFLLLILYSLFPLVLMYVDKIINKKDILIKNFIALFITFLFCSTSFANFGLIYITLLATLIYCISNILMNPKNLKNPIIAFIAVIFAIILSNSYWLIAYIGSFQENYNLAVISNYNGTLHFVKNASSFASVINLFLLQADGLSIYSYESFSDSIFLILISIISTFTIFFVIFFKNKNKFIYLITINLIISIFITKGLNPPFHEIFSFAYENIPGFGVLRRPVSKYNGIFVLFYILLIFSAYLSLRVNYSKYFKTMLSILIIFCIYLIFSITRISSYNSMESIKNNYFKPFNIPEYYKEVANIIDGKDSQTRTLVYPSFNGDKIQFNNTLNNFIGFDFLYYMNRDSRISPDKSNVSPELPYKHLTLELDNDLRTKNPNSCKLLKDLAIKYILIRYDVEKKYLDEDFFNIIENSKYLSKVIDIYDNNFKAITIYEVNKECKSSIIEVISNNQVLVSNFEYINPTKYSVTIPESLDEKKIVLKNNYSKKWVLYKDNNKLPNSNEIYNSYSNSWILDPEENGEYYIIYEAQGYFYTGLFIFMTSLLFILCIYIYLKLKNE